MMSYEHEEEKPSWVASVFLLGLILVCLGVEAKAADIEDVSPEERVLPLGPGSLVEVSDDLDFSLSREKRYCDGQDVGFFRSLMSTDCCVIRVHSLKVSNSSQIVLKRGLRAIVETSETANYALIDSRFPTSVSCGDKVPTVTSLEKALGNRMRVHRVHAGVALEKASIDTTVVSTARSSETTFDESPFKIDEI